MSAAVNFFVRWRVRLGYPLAIAVLAFRGPRLAAFCLVPL